MQTTKNTAIRKQGVVLLMAILVSGVVLAIGIGVYNRTYKELVFTIFWKQTQIAFAAADSGIECALYWDATLPQASSASCLGSTVAGWNPSLNQSTTFTISSPLCVLVEITKTFSPATTTAIKARGYNTCDTSNPRRVERGLQLNY